MPFSILELAPELISHIVDQIDDQHTLLSVARTCSHLQYLAEPKLYHSIFQRTGDEAIRLASAVAARKERAWAIHVIDSRCKWHRRTGLILLAPVIAQAKNLQQLTIESPYCNRSNGNDTRDWKDTIYQLLRPIYDIDAVDGFSNNSLPRLTQLTLHLSGEGNNGNRYWEVGNVLSMMFAHPNLQSLSISCAIMHKPAVERILGMPSTPLKKLEMVECEIDLEALDGVLSLPMALEQLYLGQNCYHLGSTHSNLRTTQGIRTDLLSGVDTTRFFTSLARQGHSLQSLCYAVNGSSSTQVNLPSDCKGFSTFTKLQSVTLKGQCAYFERALTLERTAPPGLVSLSAEAHAFRLQAPGLTVLEDYHSQVQWMVSAASIIRSLREVSISTSHTFANMKPEHREAMVKLGETFERCGTIMKLFRRITHRVVPPFLYGERPNTHELIYCSGAGQAGVPPPPQGKQLPKSTSVGRNG